MSATASSKNRTKNSNSQKRDDVKVINGELESLRASLANNLQSTLILETAIDVFFKSLKSLLSCDGLRYKNTNADALILLGHQNGNSANYSISSPGERLGEIVVFRSAPFSEPELAALEMLIGVLFYPLRNALLYKQALENSLRDPLTGIGNRAAMDYSMNRELKLAQRHNKPLSILMIDVDHFKRINDTHGHALGDEALKTIAACIEDSLRETDQVFRFGGEEFVIILPETQQRNAQMTAERIRKKIESTSIRSNKQRCKATVSAGISSLKSEDSLADLLERADSALYEAKNQGRNQVVCHKEKPQNAKRSKTVQGAA